MDKVVEKAIMNKFVIPLDNGCKENLKILKDNNLKHQETISLLKQAYKTINNSQKLLSKCEFIDSNSLLRSAMEYLAMAMLIEENDNVYNEYIDLYPEERKYTAPMKLLGMFGGKLRNYSELIFGNTNRKEREKIISDLYDTFCSYTHSSLLIHLFENIKNKKDKEVLKKILYFNLYFIKFVLYLCLKYLNKNENEYLNISNIVISFISYFVMLNNYIKDNNLNFKKYNKFLHLDDKNISYLEIYKNRSNIVLDELNNFEMTKEEKNMFEQICKDYFNNNYDEI